MAKNMDRQWNFQKTIMSIENDDEQDLYISERSSIASSDDFHLSVPSPPLKLSTERSSPTVVGPRYPVVPPPIIRKDPIDKPNNPQIERKEEKIKKINRRAPVPGHNGLATISETRTSDLSGLVHQSSHKNETKPKLSHRKLRRAPLADNQINSHESFDNPTLAAQTSLITSPIRPNAVSRVTRHQGPLVAASNQSISVENENLSQKPTSRPIPIGKDPESNDYRRTIVKQRRKPKMNPDWIDHHHGPSLSNKLTQDPNPLIITSNGVNQRTHHRSKHPTKSEHDDNGRHYLYPLNSPSIPTLQNHHSNYLSQHVRRRPPSGSQFGLELSTFETHMKKNERTNQIQTGRDVFYSPPPPPSSSLCNQTAYLPPIIREHPSKSTIPRFPNEYYGTLARQNRVKDWEETIDIPKIYKSDAQTRFFDRHLTVGSDKRLVA